MLSSDDIFLILNIFSIFLFIDFSIYISIFHKFLVILFLDIDLISVIDIYDLFLSQIFSKSSIITQNLCGNFHLYVLIGNIIIVSHLLAMLSEKTKHGLGFDSSDHIFSHSSIYSISH